MTQKSENTTSTVFLIHLNGRCCCDSSSRSAAPLCQRDAEALWLNWLMVTSSSNTRGPGEWVTVHIQRNSYFLLPLLKHKPTTCSGNYSAPTYDPPTKKRHNVYKEKSQQRPYLSAGVCAESDTRRVTRSVWRTSSSMRSSWTSRTRPYGLQLGAELGAFTFNNIFIIIIIMCTSIASPRITNVWHVIATNGLRFLFLFYFIVCFPLQPN